MSENRLNPVNGLDDKCKEVLQMDLNINLQMDDEEKNLKETTERVKKAEAKVKAQKKEPTWREVWVTGYTTHTGTHKKGIFQTTLTDKDKEKLLAVMEATDNDELPIGVESMKKYTKAHALRMYKILADSRREETIEKLVESIPNNYVLVNDVNTFEQLIADLWGEKEIAVDTETTGLNYFGTFENELDKIVGISITLPITDYHVYIPTGHLEGLQLPEEYVFEGLKPILEDTKIKKILFNAKFDIHMFRRHGIHLGGFHFDGMIGMKLLNENEPSYALKNLATKYGKLFGFQDKSATFEELFGKGGFEGVPFADENGGRGIGTFYACKDTHLTYLFYRDFVMKHFDRLPKIKRLYFDIERPILEVCIDMEQNGFLLDTLFSTNYADELSKEVQELRVELVNHFGDININSNQQLAKVLYEDLKLPDLSKGKKKGVDAKTLKKLASKNKGVKILLKYRDLNKLLTTYIEPLPLKVSKSDGRLHGTFNQVDTATGRFASKSPNLQNLPKKARQLIIAPEGKIVFGIDYSQIEPRVLSHMSDDETMQTAYREGKDLYALMASDVFRLPMENCLDGALSPDGTYEPRKRIKAVLLGIMYGMGAFTLSESINSTEAEAEALIEDFFTTYPKVKAFVESTHLEAERDEYVETMYGRKRRFVGHRQIAKTYKAVTNKINKHVGFEVKNYKKLFQEDRESEYTLYGIPYKLQRSYWDVAGTYNVVNRKSVNTKIQGTAADIMKMAMVAVMPILKKYDVRILATVHDEILFEADESITKAQVEEIEQAMLSVVNLKVPMKCDTEFMYRWGVGTGKDNWFNGERPAKQVV